MFINCLIESPYIKRFRIQVLKIILSVIPEIRIENNKHLKIELDIGKTKTGKFFRS